MSRRGLAALPLVVVVLVAGVAQGGFAPAARGAGCGAASATVAAAAVRAATPVCQLTPGGNPLAVREPGKVTRQLSEAKSVPSLLRLYDLHGAEFNEIHLATTWMALSRLRRGKPMTHNLAEGLEPLVAQSVKMASSGRLQARPVANIAYGAARSGLRSPQGAAPLYAAVASAAMRQLRDMSPQALANLAWAYATAGHPAPELFDALAQVAPRKLRGFTPQHLANLAWAYATAGHAAPALFDAIAAAATTRLRDDADEFNNQNLANLAWAFARSGQPAPAMLGAVAAACETRLDTFRPIDFSSVAWAYAVTRHDATPRLFAGIARAATPQLGSFNDQALANLAFAFVSVGHPSAGALLDAISTEATPRLDEFSVQNLANLASPYLAAGRREPALFEGVARYAAPRLGELQPMALANYALASARSGGDADPVLWEALGQTVEARVVDFPPAAVATLATAFAEAGWPAQPVFDAIAAAAAPRLREYTPKELGQMGWAFAKASFAVPRVWSTGWGADVPGGEQQLGSSATDTESRWSR